jgi:alpha-beta hydrolase superfamily lysophospholipase
MAKKSIIKKSVAKRTRVPWKTASTNELKRRLKARRKTNESIADIAHSIGRSPGAVRQKMFAEQIDAWGRTSQA